MFISIFLAKFENPFKGKAHNKEAIAIAYEDLFEIFE